VCGGGKRVEWEWAFGVLVGLSLGSATLTTASRSLAPLAAATAAKEREAVVKVAELTCAHVAVCAGRYNCVHAHARALMRRRERERERE
jgi:hypothetical protein